MNDQPLTAEQRKLAEDYIPLAMAMAKPLKLAFRTWRHDLESAALFALIKGACAYDSKKNIRFATFVRFRIRGALLDTIRELSGYKDNIEFEGLTPFSEEHGKVLVASAPAEVGWDTDSHDTVDHYLKKLPKKPAQACSLLFKYGMTQEEAARKMGCSQSEVTRLLKTARTLLS